MAPLEHTNLTYQVAGTWMDISEDQRIERIKAFLVSDAMYEHIEVCNAQDNGHITLRIEKNMPANVRGIFLLELEERLKNEFDMGVTVWLQPVGDKSKLRQLRGVEVKS